jgi:hypothetical protein
MYYQKTVMMKNKKLPQTSQKGCPGRWTDAKAKRDVEQNPDEHIDQDFSGFPSACIP